MSHFILIVCGLKVNMDVCDAFIGAPHTPEFVTDGKINNVILKERILRATGGSELTYFSACLMSLRTALTCSLVAQVRIVRETTTHTPAGPVKSSTVQNGMISGPVTYPGMVGEISEISRIGELQSAWSHVQQQALHRTSAFGPGRVEIISATIIAPGDEPTVKAEPQTPKVKPEPDS